MWQVVPTPCRSGGLLSQLAGTGFGRLGRPGHAVKMLEATLKKSVSTDRLQAAAMASPLLLAGRGSGGGRQQRHLALRFRGCHLGLPVPSEMWGAAALTVRMARPSVVQPHQLQRAASSVFAQAFSTAVVPPPAGPFSDNRPKTLAEALEWRPRLSAAEEAVSLLGPAAICSCVYAATLPASVQPLYAAGMALLCALLILGMRMLLVERQYQAVQRSEQELAAVDSCFFKVGGIQLHYKRRTPLGPRPRQVDGAAVGPAQKQFLAQQQLLQSAEPAAVVHCLHGFGASSYSWSFVQQELADALCAVVTAHDMPGFGLSQRPRSPTYYTLHFNGDAARQILDAELAQQAQRSLPPLQQQHTWQQDLCSHPLPQSASDGSLASSDADCEAEAAQQQPPKRILIGHSMGGAAAAESVISAPEGVAALVLVAPAIVAFWLGPPEEAAGDPVAQGLAVVEELVAAEDAPGEIQRLPSTSASSSGGSTPLLSRSASSSANGGNGTNASASSGGSRRKHKLGVSGHVQRAAHVAAIVVKATLLLLVRLVLTAASPLLVVLLRHVVRSRRFWEQGLASAWYDGGRVTREYVDAYRSGQLVRGWEGGVLRFLAARFGEKTGFWGALCEAVQGKGHLTQAERLAAVVRRHGIRVLILHGSGDMLVPAANSRRLAALLPSAELAVFEGCGHMPQEECPERFVETVRSFVNSLQ